MWDEDIELESVPRYCVERPSPLVCANQDLVGAVSHDSSPVVRAVLDDGADKEIDAIKPIYEARLFEERGE
jgi:hypothetical protein